MSHIYWIIFTGLNWAGMAYILLSKGFVLLQANTAQYANLMYIVGAMLVGYLKGRFVLSKTVARITKWILSQQELVPWKVYPPYYWVILAVMGSMGFIFRYLSPDIRGFADVAIGFALSYGSILYFKNAYELFASRAR